MKVTIITTAIAACLLLAACSNDTAAPVTTSQTNAAPAEAASQTEAVYGDEAPVAIEADAAGEDEHAHAADGSHPTGEDHAEDDEHAHGDDADHDHLYTPVPPPPRAGRYPEADGTAMHRHPDLTAASPTRWLLAGLFALTLAACDRQPVAGTAVAEAQVYTHFTPKTELFVEFDPLVAGAKSTFAAHFTRLSDYKPVAAGTVEVILSGGNAPSERFRVSVPRAPGIFAPTVVPRGVGRRSLSLVITAPGL